MKERIETMREISGMLMEALEENTLKTIGQAIEEIANNLIEDADQLEIEENEND